MSKKHYCGFQFLPTFLRKQLSTQFNYCCKLHDKHYSGLYSRKTADLLFLKNMLKKAKSPKWRLIAYLYYISVRLFGWISYKKK